jgi:hypothetical protein
MVGIVFSMSSMLSVRARQHSLGSLPQPSGPHPRGKLLNCPGEALNVTVGRNPAGPLQWGEKVVGVHQENQKWEWGVRAVG